MINIWNRYTRAVLYHSDTAQTIAEAVAEAYGRGANLREANLAGSNLPPTCHIASLCFGSWPVTVTSTNTQIGCERHPNKSWLAWGIDAPEIAVMHPKAVAWWTRHREAVCAVIREVMSEERTL